MKDNLIVANWLGYKRLEDGSCEIKNYLDEGKVILLNPEECRFLKRIKNDDIEGEEIDRDERLKDTLMRFIALGIVRLQKRLYSEGGETHRTVHMFRKCKMAGMPRICMWIGSMVALLLSALSLIFILWFLWAYKIDIAIIAGCLSLPCAIIATILGSTLHEFGHAMAAWGFGARVFEAGITTYWGIPNGAYILEDSTYTCGRLGRVQIKMAGIEMNLILSAILLILALAFPDFGEYGLCGAAINVCLVVLNVFSKECDGMSAIEDILQDSHVNKSVLRALLFFLPWDKLGCRKKQSAKNFIVCYVIGIIRLMPIIFFTWMGGMIFGIHFKLGRLFYGLVFAALLYVLGLLIWTIVSTFRDVLASQSCE